MKPIVAILLALNVLYFAVTLVTGGGIRTQAEGTAKFPSLPLGTPKLVLLKELKTPPEPRSTNEADEVSEPRTATQNAPNTEPGTDAPSETQATSQASPPESSSDAQHCFAIGPLPNAQIASRLQGKWFKDNSVSLLDKTEQTDTIKGYWVYLPPAASESEARETQKKLVQAGLSGGQRVASGEYLNAISLGNYRSPESADKRKSDYESQGFPVRLLARHALERRYWLVVQSHTHQRLPEGLKPELPAGATGKEVACDGMP